MRKAMLVMNSVLGSLVLTAVIAVAGLLYLMFSTGKGSVHREGLFGALFFDTRDLPGGKVGVNMGVANPTALIVIFLVLCVLLALTQIAFRNLKHYRAALIKERSNI
jgi:hypothetical protein